MAMEGLRGYLQLASGFAEMSRARAMEAASALLSLSSGLSGGRSGQSVQVQVQDLAEELLAAAAANRRSLLALVRGEVDRALANSPIPPDELDRARTALAKLSADVEELRAQVMANPAVGEMVAKLGLAGQATSRPVEEAASVTGAGGVASSRPQSAEDGLVVDAALNAPVDGAVPTPPRRRPPRAAVAQQARTRPVSQEAARDAAEGLAASTKKASTTTGATKTATKKSATKNASAKKAAKSADTGSSAKKSTAKKSTSRKSTAKKSTSTTSPSKKSAAKTAKAGSSSSAGTS